MADRTPVCAECGADLTPYKDSSWDFFQAAFLLAGIEVLSHWELQNQYWPRGYLEYVVRSPWWLVKTHVGLIKIGRRKRVWSIDWKDTPIRKIVTDDDVTKDLHYVHAWTEEKLIEYLKVLGRSI